MPGRTVTELQRRYGRAGEEVLEGLRSTVAATGTIRPDDVDRIAAEVGLPRAHVNAAASFFADLAPSPQGRRHVRVCTGTACFAASGGKHLGDVSEALGAPLGGVSEDGSTSLQGVYCLGYCYGGPAALDGERPCAGSDLAAQLAGEVPRRDPEVPVAVDVDEPVVLAGIAGGGPGAWEAWERVRGERAAERVGAEVNASGLRGRGGAGFPAAVKWRAASEAPSDGPRYLICNGDEGDPGSFVDRLLMERDPQRILEGMSLAAIAAGATHGIVYVRSEYPHARDSLRAAIADARAAGRLGGDTGFDVEVFEGAGSYVAGEETSLIHSVEGLRGEVAARPPYPTERGYLHRPTVVNNVETLASVPWIVDRGGAAYARFGVGGSRGTKVVCLNERFRRPGAYEVELGTSLRRIFTELGGGLREGHVAGAIQVGGPLGGFIGPEDLDTPLTFEAIREIGADLGHGSLIAVDERIDRAAMLRHFWTFAATESCGTCAPCRLGTRRGLEAAKAGGAPTAEEGRDEMLAAMERGSLCAFGRGVPPVVRSIERVYRGPA
ncbi:MAG: NAD(P)H-dependent oxidoreductase subunit E [Solirubrobacterales bacterium]|nr:NAD(P)H-dependent oxidoreductase subunit E [Solirubrobacterales bacterium]